MQLKIARRLQLPRELLQRARRYFAAGNGVPGWRASGDPRGGRTSATRALEARHEAEPERNSAKNRNRSSKPGSRVALRERAQPLQPDDAVHVRRFDKAGRIVPRRSPQEFGAGQCWSGAVEVPLNELCRCRRVNPVVNQHER